MKISKPGAKRSPGGKYAVGVDVGGTFTDLVLANLHEGELHRFKILTTPDQPSRGVIDGLTRLTRELSVSVAEIGYVAHATTLVTNAVIERKGTTTGLLTTSGMHDVLEVGRESRYDLYDLYLNKPKPLVKRHLRRGVIERLRADGSVHTPLDLASIEASARFFDQQDVKSVAVCFINSYRNPVHEQAVLEYLSREFPHFDVSISSEVSREVGEYERTSTVVANAYVRPMVRGYLHQLVDDLDGLGFLGQLEIMLSDGGVCSVDTASHFPVRLIESGPAAGVRAATFMADQLGLNRVLSFDMGGTTAKISFVDDGVPASSATFEAARVDRARQGSGLPLQIPTVELLEIGAGGGSIASVDPLGLLKVGPESAGADPGPAAYGRGGTEPTITDANLLLGVLSPQVFGFGAISLDQKAAAGSVRNLAKALHMSEADTAAGIVSLVNENMTNAIRLYAAERARDLRKDTLVAYGGAGPVHAYELARALGIKRLIFPWGAGTLSAFGLLMSPRSMSVSRTLPRRLGNMTSAEVDALISALQDECYANLKTTGVDRAECQAQVSVTMRYEGQGHELQVSVKPEIQRNCYDSELIRAEFERTYATVFGHALEGLPVETVTWRVQLTAPSATTGALSRDASTSTRVSKSGSRSVFFPEFHGPRSASIHQWEAVIPGQEFDGPAIFEGDDTTVIIGAAGHVTIDAFRNLVVQISEDTESHSDRIDDSSEVVNAK